MIAMFSGNRVMSMSVFGDSWRKLVPGILTARPMTDLCWTCQSNNHLIYRGANLAEDEKSLRLKTQEVITLLRIFKLNPNITQMVWMDH